MNFLKTAAIAIALLYTLPGFSQLQKKKIAAKKVAASLKIDGVLDDLAWKEAPLFDTFVELRPVPFRKELPENRTEVYILYSNEGIFVGGYLHEQKKDSIASELIGRDGFGNNDFIGVVFDTYNDKLNGFEYFVTPLGEQMDAKVSPNINGNSEDFSWNAVWQSACRIRQDGWTFEMFIPYAAIRFGKKKIQDWGLNIIRRRQKSGQQLFWQPLDPTANGFLTQEGFLTGIEDIKPPLRLQLSPYLSTYLNHNGVDKKSEVIVNGGMDVKYGLNQAFTLDMTLIPDFGQVQTDNNFLNLSPFEQRFNENRTFFTEGTELFSKGNLFYSRRIGIDPVYKRGVSFDTSHTLIEDPAQAKIINATKISGRTQKGLGVGILNALTQPQYAILQNKVTGEKSKLETMPLTNYNIFVLDQTLKHNSSISFVNTNVWRSGKDYDANVSSALFDFNDKKNMWNIGGNISVSNIMGVDNKSVTGYAHSVYFGKTSGRFNFSFFQDLSNKRYDKSDLGYFTNNNSMDQGFWMGYNWNKPKNWYNQMRINGNFWYGRLVSPIDYLKRKSLMYQNLGGNINGNAQTKKLQRIGFSVNVNADNNDFYEPRSYGRVFRNKGSVGMSLWYESNSVKKYSWSSSIFTGTGGVFKRTSMDYSLSGKARFNKKFSVEYISSISNAKNQPGWAAYDGLTAIIYFSRRNVKSVENIVNVKYSFTNRMGITLRARHSWTKVDPKQLYELDPYGDLKTPALAYTGNVNQNYNFISCDLVYNWQFAQGSFLTLVWKDFGGNNSQVFEKNYIKNLGKIIREDQYNSLSLKVIYFIDYLTAKRSLKKKAV
ncbi:MAG: carbohydrate binding family 9 domain-containing protein [Ferruginibacter sp.]|nr:carbohydrate binding family 9 domain-containing protein [Ferruginibacter sp.]